MRKSKLNRKKGKLQKKRIHKHETQTKTQMNLRDGRQDWIKRRDGKMKKNK